MGGLILFVFSGCLLWLYYRDVKDRVVVSRAVWIVVAWAVIYGSRPATEWFGGSIQGKLPSSDEGNVTEGLISLSLMAAGLSVLVRRKIRWSQVLSDNAWLVAFYFFWFLSVFWSDYSFITLKRLIRDLGTVVMALVVVTEQGYWEAIKAVAARTAYICVPLSIILIRYFPDWGRAYTGYSKSEVMWVGVATHKNTLGVLAMVGAIFLLWDLIESRDTQHRQQLRSKIPMWTRVLLLMMCWHILFIANSVTSLICAGLGSVLLLMFRMPAIRQKPWRVELLGVGVASIVLMLDFIFDIKDTLLDSVGRDPTLTTRTEIWPMLIQLQPNALVGAGFNSFWAGERLRVTYEKFGGIIQAHNGYLETYLNGGWVGVGLLICVLLAAYWRIRKELGHGNGQAAIRLVMLLISVVFNYSEASFNKIGVLWLLTVIAIMEYREQPSAQRMPSGVRRTASMPTNTPAINVTSG